MSHTKSSKFESHELSHLRSLPFFKGFADDLLLDLATSVEVLRFEPDAVILKQGSNNNHLHFLLSGRVSISVDGGMVADLNQFGDVFGEMSVISKQAAGAAVVACSQVTCLRLDATKLEKSLHATSDRFQLLLHRLYTGILTAKLAKTNERAKHFEDLSSQLTSVKVELERVNEDLENQVTERTRDLRAKTEALVASHQHLENQNLELTAQRKHLEELYASKQSTFKNLEQLYNSYFLPLKEYLDVAKNQVEGETRNQIVAAYRELNRVITMMAPLKALFSDEAALKTQSVLLAESNKKQQILAKLALGGTGVELDIVEDENALFAKAKQKLYSIVFFDVKLFQSHAQLRALQPTARFVLMTSSPLQNDLGYLKQLKELPVIVSRTEDDRSTTVKNIFTTVSKLTSQDVFGLEKYLNWGVDVRSLPVKSSQDRSQLINEMDNYFGQLGIRSTARLRAQTVTEELLMNAIYDAPVDGSGVSLFNKLSRQESVSLHDYQAATLRFATDGIWMAISVSDPFGSLSGQTILDYLESCYGGRAGQLEPQKGGAGRGLHQIVESSDLVVFNINPGAKTEVIALFQLETKQQSSTGSSLHLFVVGGSVQPHAQVPTQKSQVA